jgi:hypothetical protein
MKEVQRAEEAAVGWRPMGTSRRLSVCWFESGLLRRQADLSIG